MKDEFSSWCCRINVFSQRDKIDTLIFGEVEGLDEVLALEYERNEKQR